MGRGSIRVFARRLSDWPRCRSRKRIDIRDACRKSDVCIFTAFAEAGEHSSSAVQDLIYLILVTAILIGVGGLGRALARL
jgi:hypothetical protein